MIITRSKIIEGVKYDERLDLKTTVELTRIGDGRTIKTLFIASFLTIDEAFEFLTFDPTWAITKIEPDQRLINQPNNRKE